MYYVAGRGRRTPPKEYLSFHRFALERDTGRFAAIQMNAKRSGIALRRETS
jgi:hypothetical protein